ncbi:MAG: polyhydroxyalkanoate biosynthesis repressor PhaR [Candidatus Pelagibacter sp.]|nr:polyhydroxyalkanoate biosynthesis repressor PhaR [Candidatus Pelagibacter sp.]|tara:strand:+ start:10337 stop:11383 length:1047 start_codon:yes stop_codon:yes gene_type:complete
MKNHFIKIKNIKIGYKFKPIIIAEIGINHNGSIERAINIANSAIKNGAEIIKHQTHVAEDEMSLEAKKIKPGNSNTNIYKIIEDCSLNQEEEFKLMKFIQSKKKIFISTPFSRKAVDRLEKFKVPAYKIGSGECNNYLLVDYIAKKRKPIILSTGMNSIKTIKPATKIIEKYKVPYALLHCTNIYPTPAKLVRLNDIDIIKKNFPKAVVGLSDHTANIYSALGAVSLGASIVEKHFVDSKKIKGPDISASMDPKELRELIYGSEQIFLARSSNKKKPVKEEQKTINFAFASAVATKDIFPGEKLSLENFFLKRPGNGDFNIENYKTIIGKKVLHKIKKNTQIKKTSLK